MRVYKGPIRWARRFDKETSTELFKYVSKVKVHFNPFDHRNTSAWNVLSRLHADRYRKANPKFVWDINYHRRASAPLVEFTFVDGSEYKINPSDQFHSEEILYRMTLKAQKVDFEYDIEGKDIDNM